MIRKVELATPRPQTLFAEPSPLGLIGLAIACAALIPMALGYGLSPVELKGTMKTAAIFCLFFGAGCQFLAGMMSFANKNLFGGTLFTAFSFSWLTNYWALNAFADGVYATASTVFAVDVTMLIIFIVFTYGFGFFSKLLFVFLLDIDLLYVAKVAKFGLVKAGVLAAAKPLDLAILLFTVALAAIALWLAFGTMINITAGKQLFKIPGPLFQAPRRQGYDWSLRFNLFDVLYKHWQEHAFEEMTLEDLQAKLKQAGVERNIIPDLFYLKEYGALELVVNGVPNQPKTVRLTAGGIDLYEQLILKKYEFAA